MRNVRRLAVATILLLLPAVATAQEFGLDLNTGYYLPLGSNYDNYENAFGVDVRMFAQFSGGLEAGLGLAHIGYSAAGTNIAIPHWEVYGEPRFDFATGSPITPFVGARVGWIHQSMTILGVKAETDGFTAAAVAGIDLDLNPWVALDATVLFAHHAFGDATVGGQKQTGSSFGAQTLGFRAGLRIILPNAPIPGG